MRIKINTGIKERSGKSLNSITALTSELVGKIFCVVGGYSHPSFTSSDNNVPNITGRIDCGFLLRDYIIKIDCGVTH